MAHLLIDSIYHYNLNMKIEIKNSKLIIRCIYSYDTDLLKDFFNKNNITKVVIENVTFISFCKLKELAEIIYDKKIKSLKIIGSRLDKDALDVLVDIISQNPYLTSISLSESTTIKILESFKNNFTIKKIMLDRNSLRYQQIEILLNSINDSVTSLSLFNNNMGGETAVLLANYLAKNVSLQELYLGNNMILDTGCNAIMDALKQNKNLKTINLANNIIFNIGSSIADMLEHNKSLQCIHLEGNLLPSCEIVDIFNKLCINSSLDTISIGHLKTLDEIVSLTNMMLSNTSITNLSLYDTLFTLEMINTFAKVLCDNTIITSLTMYNCTIVDKGVRIFFESLSKNSCIKNLHIVSSCVSDEYINLIANAISVNTTIRKLHLSSSVHFNNITTFMQSELSNALNNNYTITDINLSSQLSPELQAIVDRNIRIFDEQRFKKTKVCC